MHGYHPKDPQSYAMLCTNQAKIPEVINAIPDVYRLMVRDADLASRANAIVSSSSEFKQLSSSREMEPQRVPG